jgi:branched-chain amino acid transport system substrate-binding protein
VLAQCGDDLTHANVMRQAANLRDVRLPMLLPGIVINTSAETMRFLRNRGWRALMANDGY